MTLGSALAVLLLAGAAEAAAPPKTSPSAERARVLAMFARAYYPGRSGQIALVPKRGSSSRAAGPTSCTEVRGTTTCASRCCSGALAASVRALHRPRAQQDVAPTLARMLGVVLPGATGRPLGEALVAHARPPRAVLLLVLDGMRADYLERHAGDLPTLGRLSREGASFSQARVTYAPSITTAGHATVATGADPRVHGVVSNTSSTARPVRSSCSASLAPEPHGAHPGRRLERRDGRPGRHRHPDQHRPRRQPGGPRRVSARRAPDALRGLRPRRPATGRRTPPASGCTRAMPSLDSRSVWEREGGTWMGHAIADPDAVRRTAPFAAFEGDAVVALLEHEPIGQDDVTDLVLVNLKVPDFIGHAYGPDSAELRAGPGRDRPTDRPGPSRARSEGRAGLTWWR